VTRGETVVPSGGKEWIVDASGCTADKLRDASLVRSLVEIIVAEMSLRPVAAPLWHVFPGEAGVTGMVLLAESHVAVHTFPEHGTLTLNVYSCRERAEIDFRAKIQSIFSASQVSVRALERGLAP
jgi:S-adenosylmethionine decarboxylase